MRHRIALAFAGLLALTTVVKAQAPDTETKVGTASAARGTTAYGECR